MHENTELTDAHNLWRTLYGSMEVTQGRSLFAMPTSVSNKNHPHTHTCCTPLRDRSTSVQRHELSCGRSMLYKSHVMTYRVEPNLPEFYPDISLRGQFLCVGHKFSKFSPQGLANYILLCSRNFYANSSLFLIHIINMLCLWFCSLVNSLKTL